MDAKALRRKQVRRESVGYLTLPALYGTLMAVGVFAFSPTLVLVSFALVGLLLMQLRSAAIAGALLRPARAPPGEAPPREAVEAADARFLQQVTYTLAANVAAYLALLAGIDQHVRAIARGDPPGFALVLGVAAALVLVFVGREAARRAAWSGFKELYPALWQSKAAFDCGRATRSAATYFDWRLRAEPSDA